MSTKVVAMSLTESNSGMPTENKLACNAGVMKNKNGLLKLFQILIGIILLIVFFQEGWFGNPLPSIAFILCIFSTMVPGVLLLVSYLISPMAAETLPKLFFELLYNVFSFLYYTCASLALIVILAGADSQENDGFSGDPDTRLKKTVALILLGFVNGALYFTSSFYGYRLFKSS